MSKRIGLKALYVGIAGVAALGVGAYALRLRLRASRRRPVLRARPARELPRPALWPPLKPPHAALNTEVRVPSGEARDPLELDLDGVFRAPPDSEPELSEVHADERIPPPSGGDDAEPPEAEALGQYWLARATQAEQSWNERDLEEDLNNLAEPGAQRDVP